MLVWSKSRKGIVSTDWAEMITHAFCSAQIGFVSFTKRDKQERRVIRFMYSNQAKMIASGLWIVCFVLIVEHCSGVWIIKSNQAQYRNPRCEYDRDCSAWAQLECVSDNLLSRPHSIDAYCIDRRCGYSLEVWLTENEHRIYNQESSRRRDIPNYRPEVREVFGVPLPPVSQHGRGSASTADTNAQGSREVPTSEGPSKASGKGWIGKSDSNARERTASLSSIGSKEGRESASSQDDNYARQFPPLREDQKSGPEREWPPFSWPSNPWHVGRQQASSSSQDPGSSSVYPKAQPTSGRAPESISPRSSSNRLLQWEFQILILNFVLTEHWNLLNFVYD